MQDYDQYATDLGKCIRSLQEVEAGQGEQVRSSRSALPVLHSLPICSSSWSFLVAFPGGSTKQLTRFTRSSRCASLANGPGSSARKA